MAVLIQHVEGWRRRPSPHHQPPPSQDTTPAGTKPPTSRTHRGAPAQDRRIAGDGADGDAIEGGAGAEREVDVNVLLSLMVERIRWDGGESDGTGAIRQHVRCQLFSSVKVAGDIGLQRR